MKLEDIAKLANVSIASVSLALNDRPGISQETRNKILKIANEHNFVLSKNRVKHNSHNDIVRLVIYGKNANYKNSLDIINNISKECKEQSFSLLVSYIEQSQLYKDLYSLESNQKSIGIILLTDNIPLEMIEKIKKINHNLVILNTYYPQSPSCFITPNYFQAGYIAGKYLVSLGHKKIGYAHSGKMLDSSISKKHGFMSSLKENHIDLYSEGTYSEDQLNILLKDNNLPTAIFCEEDSIAISIIKILTSTGIKVPEQISIIGFGNISEGRAIIPELTTIDSNMEWLSKHAINSILNLLLDKTYFSNISIGTSIIERNSCYKLY